MPSQENQVMIPINYEHRTFEKHRRDMLTNLENKSGSPKSSPEAKRPVDDRSEITPFRDDWFDELSEWANSSWKQWDDEMRRIRRGILSLWPLDYLGLTEWTTSNKLMESSKLIDIMEEKIDELREYLGYNDELTQTSSSVTDYLKDAYEVDKDGSLRFKIRFNVTGFKPNDLQISCQGNYLMVYAKKVEEKDNSRKDREFCRILELPHSVDPNDMECQLTEDGVLMIEAPVKSPDYNSITFNDERKLGIRPMSVSDRESQKSQLSVKGVAGPTIMDDENSGKKLHLEMPVDSRYKPEDLCITVDSDKITVTGKYNGKSSDKMEEKKNVPEAEFKHSYCTPVTLDPLSIKAQLDNGVLVIEAPMTIGGEYRKCGRLRM